MAKRQVKPVNVLRPVAQERHVIVGDAKGQGLAAVGSHVLPAVQLAKEPGRLIAERGVEYSRAFQRTDFGHAICQDGCRTVVVPLPEVIPQPAVFLVATGGAKSPAKSSPRP